MQSNNIFVLSYGVLYKNKFIQLCDYIPKLVIYQNIQYFSVKE